MPETKKKSYFDLLVELETYKHGCISARRPLIIHRNIVLFVILLIISAIIVIGITGGTGYISGWSVFTLIVSAFSLIVLTVFFFLNDTSEGKRYGFFGRDRIEEMIGMKKGIAETELLIQIFQQHQTTRLSIEEQTDLYKDNLRESIQEYQGKANQNRWLYFTLQLVIIACSLFVGGLTSGLNDFITIFGNHWLAPILSFTVSFLTAMITLFRPRERAYNLQQTADAIQFEIDCANRRIYSYKGLSPADIYVKLAEEIEKLRYEQRKRQQQLEQASATKQATD